MSTPEQECYDTVRTTTIKVGGEDARLTLQRIFQKLKECVQLVGMDGVVVVTVSAHVPQRRLPAG